MTFKTGTEVKKDREKHSGTVFAVSDTYIVLKEETGNHVYHPAKGKVTDYLKPIQPGEVITFESMKEKNGDQTIVWVIAWERVHKSVSSTGDADRVAKDVVTPGQKQLSSDEIKKQADEFAQQLTAGSPPPKELPRKFDMSLLTDSQKRDMRIGWYSNLNTAVEIVQAALSTYPSTGKDKVPPMTIPEVEAAVLSVAKNIHDYVEDRIALYPEKKEEKK
jgi:hypothetical protein